MNEGTPRGLQKLDVEARLPVGFEQLSQEDQRAIRRKLQDGLVDVQLDMHRAIGKSRVAENDLNLLNDAVARLDHERKIYSSKVTAETGSGKIDMQVRGGDTRFLIPILVTVGAILLAVVAIFALR